MQVRKKVPLLVQDLVSEVILVGRKRHTVLWGNGIPFLKGRCLKGRFQHPLTSSVRVPEQGTHCTAPCRGKEGREEGSRGGREKERKGEKAHNLGV